MKSENNSFRISFHLLKSLIASLIIIAVPWIVFLIEQKFDTSFHVWGIYPRSVQGMPGIIFSVFIHGDIQHLLSNSLPLALLSFFSLYFYPHAGWRAVLLIWLAGSLWTWLLGRPSYHIGASGLIYGMAAFLVLSGWLSRYYRLIAVALLVIFLYGSLFWGIFPVQPDVSWEAHAMGVVAGLVAAWYFRHALPQREIYDWENEEDDNENSDNTEPPYWESNYTFPHNIQS